MSSSTDLVPWGEQFASRRERRERRAKRRFILAATIGPTAILGTTLLAAVWINQPPREAAAAEVPATTAPASPEWTVPPPTTVLVPESVPTSTAPPWVEVRVTVPGWDGLGRIVTDGIHHRLRVLPGALGVSVIGIAGDPASAQTVIVGDTEWHVFNRGQVAPDNLDSLANRRPMEPVVVLVSMQPGPARNYVEARK